MKLLRLFYFLVVLMIIPLILVGIGEGQEELAKQQVLRDGVPDDDIKGLDPIDFLGTSGEPMSRALYEGLVRFNFGYIALDKMEPALAESWKVSPDGLTWTFKLRKGVQFHHGYGEFTAEDVKFTITRILEKKSRHAVDYVGIDQIVVVDPYMIQFKLKKPDAFFLFKVGNFHGGSIVSKKAVKDLGDAGFRGFPVGTGPFAFEKWTSKEKVVLVRNNNYWRGAPILEKIEFIFMPDVNTRSLALEKGAIDATTSGVDDEQWVTSMRGKGIIVDALGFDVPMMLHFNMTVKPLDNLKVRQALAYAISRRDFIDFHGPSITKPQISPLPPGMYGSMSKGLPLYEYNPARAKQLLAEAGYPKGFDLGRVYSSVRALYLDPLEIIQAQWAKIGVTFNIQAVAHSEFHALIRKDLNPIVCYPGPRPTPDMILTQYLHSNSIVGKKTAVTNFSHYGDLDLDGDGINDSIDDFIDRARVELDPEKQKGLYAQAQIKILKDLPVYPLRVMAAVQARQKWVDLGHEPYEGSYINGYAYTELTRILKH